MQGNTDPVSEGFILMMDEVIQIIHHISLINQDLMVIGRKVVSDMGGMV